MHQLVSRGTPETTPQYICVNRGSISCRRELLDAEMQDFEPSVNMLDLERGILCQCFDCVLFCSMTSAARASRLRTLIQL